MIKHEPKPQLNLPKYSSSTKSDFDEIAEIVDDYVSDNETPVFDESQVFGTKIINLLKIQNDKKLLNSSDCDDIYNNSKEYGTC